MVVSADYGGAVVRSQILHLPTSPQLADSAPHSPTIPHAPVTGSGPNFAGSAAIPPGSESVPIFQDPHSSDESDSSIYTLSAADKVPVENRKRKPPLSLQGSDDSCNECSFKKPCSEPNTAATSTHDVNDEETSQPPLAQKALSSNSSRSGSLAILSGQYSEVSSDEERLFETPLSTSPESLLSVALSGQPMNESQKATTSAEFDSIVNSESSNSSCECDIKKAISKSGKSSTGPKDNTGSCTVYTQDKSDRKTLDFSVDSRSTTDSNVNSDDVNLEIPADPKPLQDKSKSASATTEDGSGSEVDVTAISQQDGSNKLATNSPAGTKEDGLSPDSNVTTSQLEGNNTLAKDDPAEIRRERSASDDDVVASSLQVSNNYISSVGKQGSPPVDDDKPESNTLPTDHISRGTDESSATVGKNNTEDNNSPHLGTMLSAFNPPHDKAINMYFKAILPKRAWEWDNSGVFLQFMHLGSNTCIGPGSFRTVDDHLLLVEFDVKMDIDVLYGNEYIFYKYSVLSRRTRHTYEYLHGVHTKGMVETRLINRALKIDQSKCFPGG